MNAKTLDDPSQVEALTNELGFEWAIVLARDNPHLKVVAALAELLHGTRRRHFSAAADAVTRFPHAAQLRHLHRAMKARDRDTAIGRARIECALLRLEDNPRFNKTLHTYLRTEKSRPVAKQLLWSLVHQAPDDAATATAILAVAKRLPETRKEAAAALRYCPYPVRAAPLTAFLKELPASQRAMYRSFRQMIVL